MKALQVDDPRCKACRFWVPSDSDRLCGHCHGMPPVRGGNVFSSQDERWAFTWSMDWCGLHRPMARRAK